MDAVSNATGLATVQLTENNIGILDEGQTYKLKNFRVVEYENGPLRKFVIYGKFTSYIDVAHGGVRLRSLRKVNVVYLTAARRIGFIHGGIGWGSRRVRQEPRGSLKLAPNNIIIKTLAN